MFTFEGIVLGLIFKKRRVLVVFTGVFMNLVTAAIGYLFF